MLTPCVESLKPPYVDIPAQSENTCHIMGTYYLGTYTCDDTKSGWLGSILSS